MSALLLRLLPSAWSRVAVAAALLVGLAGLAFARGIEHERTKWEAAAAIAERDYLAAVVRAARIAERVVVEYVDRVRVVREAGDTIIREVPVYVTPEADRRCVVPRGFVRVHDAAAHGLPLPGATGPADEAAAGIALSAVAGTVTANYTDCHAIREQVIALQAWIEGTRGHE